ncbi:hypothetical protein C2S51_013123 [Perilla frutescens var. frutescens]|nr:hypothetical protein C2S51_013123 [Perilla frutescens var. frutescens]
MAPKRRPAGRAVRAVVTAKRVVEETVEVVVTPPEGLEEGTNHDDDEGVKLPVSSASKTQPHEPAETGTAPAPPPKYGGKKRRRRGGGGEYKRYLLMVMKEVHPDMGISSKAMTIVNNLMSDMFERIAEEAARLQKYTRRRTLSSREIQGAVKLVLPGELGKHAVAEGTKAVTTYIAHLKKL